MTAWPDLLLTVAGIAVYLHILRRVEGGLPYPAALPPVLFHPLLSLSAKLRKLYIWHMTLTIMSKLRFNYGYECIAGVLVHVWCWVRHNNCFTRYGIGPGMTKWLAFELTYGSSYDSFSKLLIKVEMYIWKIAFSVTSDMGLHMTNGEKINSQHIRYG